MQQLTLEQIDFDPASYSDPNGRVFYLGTDVYRAVTPPLAPVYRQLLMSPQAERLFECGLVRTEVAPLTLDGYPLVLKHARIPFRSYGFEWCGAMLRDAALLLLDLSLSLAEMEFEFQDANPWNIMFDGCRPTYIDFGSIIPVQSETGWRPFAEFIKCFLNPLWCITHGQGTKARQQMADWTRWGVRGSDLSLTLLLKSHLAHLRYGTLERTAMRAPRVALLRRLKQLVESLVINPPQTEWSEYYQGFIDPHDQTAWTPKQTTALDVITRMRPATVLDVGSNAGWYTKLASQQGSHVVAFDLDETCIHRLYTDPEKEHTRILPLLLDACHPSPRHGKRDEFPSAQERLRCELVFTFALVHHLVFKQRLSFATIADALAAFTGKALLIEFVPREDKYVSEWYTKEFAWYTEDGFLDALHRHFRTITKFPSNRPPACALLV